MNLDDVAGDKTMIRPMYDFSVEGNGPPLDQFPDSCLRGRPEPIEKEIKESRLCVDGDPH